MKLACGTKYSHLLVDVLLSDLFQRHHFNIIELSTCNGYRGLHEKKIPTSKTTWYYFIAFHQGVHDFHMHDPLRDSVRRACTYMSLEYFKKRGGS